MRYEFIKLFSNKKVIIIIVVMLGINIYLATRNSTVMYEGFNSKVYEFYMENLQGEYNEHKHRAVMDEYLQMQELLEKEEIYLQQYKDKCLPVNEYKVIASDISKAKSRIKTMEYIVEKTQYYSECRNTPSYFYDIDVNDYVQNMGVNLPLVLVLICIIAIVHNEDYYSNTVNIIRSSKYGKEYLFKRRVICVCICTLTLSMIFYVVELGTKLLVLNMEDMNANISSLLCMRKTGLNLTIIEYVCLTIIYRVFFTTLISIILSVIAVFLHKYITVFAVSVCLIFVPELLTDSLLAISEGLKVYPLFSTSKEIFGCQFAWIYIIIYSMLSAMMLSLGIRKCRRN